jgi:hypothetical protein
MKLKVSSDIQPAEMPLNGMPRDTLRAITKDHAWVQETDLVDGIKTSGRTGPRTSSIREALDETYFHRKKVWVECPFSRIRKDYGTWSFNRGGCPRLALSDEAQRGRKPLSDPGTGRPGAL